MQKEILGILGSSAFGKKEMIHDCEHRSHQARCFSGVSLSSAVQSGVNVLALS